MAAETERLVDAAPFFYDLHLPRRHRCAAGNGRRRLQQEVADLLDPSCLVRPLRGLDDVGEIGRLEETKRQERLYGDVGVGVLWQRVIVGVERSIPCLVERLTG